jgi:hypothetical protein
VSPTLSDSPQSCRDSLLASYYQQRRRDRRATAAVSVGERCASLRHSAPSRHRRDRRATVAISAGERCASLRRSDPPRDCLDAGKRCASLRRSDPCDPSQDCRDASHKPAGTPYASIMCTTAQSAQSHFDSGTRVRDVVLHGKSSAKSPTNDDEEELLHAPSYLPQMPRQQGVTCTPRAKAPAQPATPGDHSVSTGQATRHHVVWRSPHRQQAPVRGSVVRGSQHRQRAQVRGSVERGTLHRQLQTWRGGGRALNDSSPATVEAGYDAAMPRPPPVQRPRRAPHQPSTFVPRIRGVPDGLWRVGTTDGFPASDPSAYLAHLATVDDDSDPRSR